MTRETPRFSLRPAHLAAALLTLAAVLCWTPPARAFAPLGYSWSCSSQYCSFHVTTTNHAAYLWNFGDGTITGISTSTTATHVYNVPNDNQFHYFTVYLAGYATVSSGSPDNVIGCTIAVAGSSVGIHTSGSCSG
jgi:hypothetical protein